MKKFLLGVALFAIPAIISCQKDEILKDDPIIEEPIEDPVGVEDTVIVIDNDINFYMRVSFYNHLGKMTGLAFNEYPEPEYYNYAEIELHTVKKGVDMDNTSEECYYMIHNVSSNIYGILDYYTDIHKSYFYDGNSSDLNYLFGYKQQVRNKRFDTNVWIPMKHKWRETNESPWFSTGGGQAYYLPLIVHFPDINNYCFDITIKSKDGIKKFTVNDQW